MLGNKYANEIQRIQGITREKMDFVASEFGCDLTLIKEDKSSEEGSYSLQSLFEMYTSMFKRVKIDEPLLQLLTIVCKKVAKQDVKSSSGVTGPFNTFTLYTDQKQYTIVQFRPNDAKKAKNAAVLLTLRNKFPFFYKFYIHKKDEYCESTGTKGESEEKQTGGAENPSFLPPEDNEDSLHDSQRGPSKFYPDQSSQNFPNRQDKGSSAGDPKKPAPSGNNGTGGATELNMGDMTAMYPTISADAVVSDFRIYVDKERFRSAVPIETVKMCEKGFSEVVDALFDNQFSIPMSIMFNPEPNGNLGVKAMAGKQIIFMAQVKSNSKAEAKEAICKYFLGNALRQDPRPSRFNSSGKSSNGFLGAKSLGTPLVKMDRKMPRRWSGPTKPVCGSLECPTWGSSLQLPLLTRSQLISRPPLRLASRRPFSLQSGASRKRRPSRSPVPRSLLPPASARSSS